MEQLSTEQVLQKVQSLEEAGQHDNARMLLLELLKNEPNNQTALLMLGGSYFITEKYPEAEMVFERLVLLESGDGKYSIALFNALWKQGRLDEAGEEIRRFMLVADKVAEQETINQYIAITKQLAGDESQ